MTVLYLHAEISNFAVVGTANRNEHALGFFVKHGDGGIDVNPIAHLYKSQVYQLAEFLGIPEEIRSRKPTTDTYGAPATQEEFFFRIPFPVMDLIWCGLDNGIPVAEIAHAANLSQDQVQRVAKDLDSKRRATEYLRMPAITFPAVNSASMMAADNRPRLELTT